MLAPPQLPRNLEASFRDLDSTKPETRVSAIHDLLRHAREDEAVRTRAIPLLEMRLADVMPKVRAAAVVGLADLVASDTVPALLRSVDDDDAYVRQMVLNALGELGDARALLESESTSLKVVAAILLGKSGERDGNALLLRVVRGDTISGQSAEKEDERAAVELVGELGLEEARPHLERRAWGLKRLVRDTCVFHAKIALARMGHPRAIDEIMKDLASPRPEVLGGAVVAAGRARLAQARPRIAALAEGVVDAELVKEALAQLDQKASEQT